MTPFVIDWMSAESYCLLNPLLPKAMKDSLEFAVAPYRDLKNHFWIASSGTENFPKMVALSKEAFLASAHAVNNHLQIEEKYSWLNILPLFHVGGLGIHARAFLTQSPIFDFSTIPWSPEGYLKLLTYHAIRYSSLTPTHVYDIVSRGLKAPEALIGVIVGGGVLSLELHQKAFELGWPLLTSYGMTEMCSQIATATDPTPGSPLQILKHVEMRFTSKLYIEIKSPALLTGFVLGNDGEHQFIDPKRDGWYTTQDRGEMTSQGLLLHGRGSHFLKIGGENVNFSQLEAIWEKIRIKYRFQNDTALVDLPHERLGSAICLAATISAENKVLGAMIAEFQEQVLPIAKIRRVYELNHIPRSELHKLKKNELRRSCKNRKNRLL